MSHPNEPPENDFFARVTGEGHAFCRLKDAILSYCFMVLVAEYTWYT